jgi:glycosyltransferase involved in cell wall biosynthesis
MKKLVVIARHSPSVLLKKGEYIARYYNPKNVFDEVHLILTNNDKPDIEQLQFSSGKAKLFIHNLPRPDFLRTLGWRSFLIDNWIQNGVDIVQGIDPQLIRVHNNFLEGFLAQKIKQLVGIPYVVSIHHSEHQFRNTFQRKILGWLLSGYETGSLREADAVIGVYKSNFAYAQELKGNDPRLIYNVVSDKIAKKSDYSISKRPRLITINQQKQRKNPANIIRAIRNIDCEYWIVGNGPAHQDLQELVREEGLEHKVQFHTGIPNDQLTHMLKDFDLHVSHCDVWGMSKTVVESSLAALPTLINFHPTIPIPEYDDSWIMRCDNTATSYAAHIERALKDEGLRRKFGRNAYKHATNNFGPKLMEKKLANLYTEKMLPGT